MEFGLTEEMEAALMQFLQSHGPWVAIVTVLILASPKIIPAISGAVIEHRKLSHKRQDQLRKINASIAKRHPEALPNPDKGKR